MSRVSYIQQSFTNADLSNQPANTWLRIDPAILSRVLGSASCFFGRISIKFDDNDKESPPYTYSVDRSCRKCPGHLWWSIITHESFRPQNSRRIHFAGYLADILYPCSVYSRTISLNGHSNNPSLSSTLSELSGFFRRQRFFSYTAEHNNISCPVVFDHG